MAVYAGKDLKEFVWEAVKAGCGMVGHATDGAGNVDLSRILSRERSGLAFGGRILLLRLRASRREVGANEDTGDAGVGDGCSVLSSWRRPENTGFSSSLGPKHSRRREGIVVGIAVCFSEEEDVGGRARLVEVDFSKLRVT